MGTSRGEGDDTGAACDRPGCRQGVTYGQGSGVRGGHGFLVTGHQGGTLGGKSAPTTGRVGADRIAASKNHLQQRFIKYGGKVNMKCS